MPKSQWILLAISIVSLLICGCQKPPEPAVEVPASPAPQAEKVAPVPPLSPDGVPTGPAIWCIAGREFVVFDITGRELLRRPLGVTGRYSDLDWDGSSLWAAYQEGETREIHRLEPGTGYVLLRLGVPGADGVAKAAEGLWVSDEAKQRLYLINADNGEVLREIVMPMAGALAWDGRNIWIAQNAQFRIRSFDPAMLRNIAATLPLMEKAPTPPPPPAETATKEGEKTVKPAVTKVLSAALPAFLSEIISPGPNIRGLDWDGEHLLAADPDAGKIFILNTKDGLVVGQLFVRGVVAIAWQPCLVTPRPPRVEGGTENK